MTSHITPNTPTAVGAVVLGSFKLLSVLAAGSYATAYIAEQIGIDRKVVVKVAHPHLMSSNIGQMIRTRFLQELKVMAKINHPNLVTLFSAGDTPDGLPALAMEYVEGYTLASLLASYAPLQFSQYESIFRQLIEALGALHSAGVIHRDVTPHNIIVSRNHDGQPHVKLLDFGVAQQENISNGTLGPIGTPRYLAPEQIQNRASAASDIFSVGALLWWTTTGSEFMNDVHHISEYIMRVLAMKTPPDPRVVDPNIPVHMAKLIGAMLHPDPAQRPTQSQILTYWNTLRQHGFTSSKSNPRLTPSPHDNYLSTSSNLELLSPPNILLLDLLGEFTPTLQSILRATKCNLTCVATVNDAAEQLNTAFEPFDVVLCVAEGLDFSPQEIVQWLRDSLGDLVQSGPGIILISEQTWPDASPDAYLPPSTTPSDACEVISYLLGKKNKLLAPRVTNPNLPVVSRITNAQIPAFSAPKTNPLLDQPPPFTSRPSTGGARQRQQNAPAVKDFIGKIPDLLVELTEPHLTRQKRAHICQQIASLATQVGAQTLTQQANLLGSLPLSASVQEIDAFIEVIEQEYTRAFRALNT